MGNLTRRHKAQFKCHLLQEASLDFLNQSSASLAPSTTVLAFQPYQFLASVFLTTSDKSLRAETAFLTHHCLLTGYPAQGLAHSRPLLNMY